MANKDKVELNKEHRFYKNPLKKGETYSNPNHPKYKAAQKAEEDRIGYSFPYDDEGNLKKFPPYEQQKIEEKAMIDTMEKGKNVGYEPIPKRRIYSPSAEASMRRKELPTPEFKKGGSVKAAASRIKSSASRRADGAAQRGRTKGRTL